MACTTLAPHELNQPTGNPHLDEVLAQVRRITGEDWQVLRYRKVTRRRFRRPKSEPIYALFVHIGGFMPYLQVNFYHEGTEGSVEGWAKAETAINFLHGVVAGLRVLAAT